MSYNRSFSETVAVHYSGTVSYPASEHGGTISYSGTAYDDVYVDIHVDTIDFDNSVHQCNQNVNGLTASIGVMNAAQCKAVNDNANKVSDAIINGFFRTVKTDLQTQKVELEQVIESRLILLRQQVDLLREKQENMKTDYTRTSARYQKIFSDINKELSARIHKIDQPVFDFVKDVDEQNSRMLHTDMVQNVITLSKENEALQSQINVALVKQHALNAMNQASNFLISKAITEKALQNASLSKSGQEKFYIPVCYMKTKSVKNEEQKCYITFKYKDYISEQLQRELSEIDLGINTESENSQIKAYFENEVTQKVKGNDIHSSRVKTMILKMFNKTEY